MMPKSTDNERNTFLSDCGGEEQHGTLKRYPRNDFEDQSDDSEGDRGLLDGSRRSASSRTADGGTYATSRSNSPLSLKNQTNSDDLTKKKKSKKKKDTEKDSSKKKKKKKEKRRKRVANDDDDDNLTTVTQSDEKLVDELCSALSKTLSTPSNTEAFLTLLKDRSVLESYDSRQNPVDESRYQTLQSPEPSVCGSYSSHVSTLSFMHTIMPHSETGWTEVDPPSVGLGSSAYTFQSPTTRPKPSIQLSRHKILRNGPMEPVEVISPNHSITTLKRSNLKKVVEVSPKSEKSTPTKTSGSPSPQFDLVEESSSDNQPQPSISEESSPEELFLALPSEFRSYLLGLHAEELRNANETRNENQQKEKLMSCVPARVPTQTQRDCDELSMVSELTGMTGMMSNFLPGKSTTHKDPFGLNIHGNIIDNSSDGSDDSDDESQESGPRLDAPPMSVSREVHPRRSSLVHSQRQEPKRVRFTLVHVREYDTVLDCNPAVTEGPAIAIGWNVLRESKALIGDHDDGRHRRHGDSLMLSTHTREAILLKLGVLKTDIDSAVRRIQKAQNHRRRTALKVRAQSVEFAMERVGKSFRDLLARGSSNSKMGS